VVGANSVVLSSVEPQRTVFGVPARVVPSSVRN
jgi:serine acetyltransferase